MARGNISQTCVAQWLEQPTPSIVWHEKAVAGSSPATGVKPLGTCRKHLPRGIRIPTRNVEKLNNHAWEPLASTPMTTSTLEQRKTILEAIGKLTDFDTDQRTTWDRFQEFILSHYSRDEYTYAVVNDGLEYLDGKGYIKSLHSAQRKWLHLRLTFAGKEFYYHGEPERQPMNQFNFNAQTNFQQGNHNVQNIKFGVSDEQVQAIIGALRTDNKVELADEIQAEVVQAKQLGKLAGFMGKLITAAATAGTSSATTQALTQLFN